MFARLFVLSLLALGASAAQAAGCNESIRDSDGFTILRVVANVRWSGSGLDADSPVQPGSHYTQANVNLARDHLHDLLRKQDDSSVEYLSRISARYITTCTVVEGPGECQRAAKTDKCVSLQLNAYTVQIPLLDTSGLALSAPRAPTDTNIDGVPPALFALSPKASLATDSALGTSAQLHTSTDLGLMADFLKGQSLSAQPTGKKYQTVLSLDGLRSLDSPYYNGSLRLTSDIHFKGTLKKLSGEATYSAAITPMADGHLRINALSTGVSAVLGTSFSPFRSFLLRASYNHNANELSQPNASAATHENGLLTQLATEGFLQSATIRTSLWFQHNSTAADQTYSRFLVRSGLEKSVAIVPHQTIDLEVLGGYGRTAGTVPAQDKFVGGSAGAGFMDNEFASTSEEAFPTGPIQRSYGVGKLDWLPNAQSQDAAGKDQSFAHINLTAAIPIHLSRPLIPHLIVFDNKTVADMINARVDHEDLLKATLESQGMSEQEAQKEQDRVMKAVRPAVHFITEQANVWSVKPMVLFDWVHTNPAQATGAQTSWPAAGGGIQFGIVTAQLRAAYIRSFDSGTNASPGNFLFRLTFQNLF